jgi:hypothetical protein
LIAKKYDDNFLAIQNKRRASKKQKIYSSIEEWRNESNDVKSKNKKEDTRPLPEKDPILYETGNIFADYINHLYSTNFAKLP